MGRPPRRDLDQCSFCESNLKVNLRLCNECQIWNIEEHVFTCKNQADVNLDALSYVKPPEPLRGKTVPGLDRFEDLNYISAEEYGARRTCMLCREIYHGTLMKKLQIDEGAEVRLSPVRPFAAGKLLFDLKNKGEPRGQSPYTVECVLPIILEQRFGNTSNEEGSAAAVAYSTFTIELILSYDHDGQSLLEVTPWDRSFFNTNFIKKWLSYCQEAHDYDCNETVAPMSLPSGFRLIDTLKRCVIIPPMLK
ncbi:hypothetical protein F4810DRAFT_675400 [Camillea tinctor]|nr:hypothetical protein F4810DRAFT_675400 [Camillea tinctor]